MRATFKTLVVLFAVLLPAYAFSQCTECIPDDTCTSEDDFPSICPEELPNGTAGTYYETFITFFMPGSVTDPGSGIEATLNEIVVAGVAGLPFGMTWQTNSPNNTYFPSQGENLGCASLCGTPILAGEYEVVITVNVQVTAFGFDQSLTESFSLPLTIEPGTGGNATFSFDNIAGCGSVESNFTALIDGSPGVTTYAWDFGNDQTSSSATPPTQVYTEPGEYTVTLTTTIENYNLSSVAVSQLNNDWCGDIEEPTCTCGVPIINFCPDPYFTITDGNGSVVYASSEFSDVETAAWAGINFLLTNPPYTITIWDADLISADDNLGSASFELSTGTQSFNASGSIGTITITLEISNVFTNEETVQVFPFPEVLLVLDNDVLTAEGEEIELYLWTLNGLVIQEGPENNLEATEPGVYVVDVFNGFGCTASDTLTICPTVEPQFNNSTMTVSVEPGFASYSWTFNGLPIPGADGPSVDANASGNYSVTITTEYGCEVTSEVFQLDLNVAEGTRLTALNVWPNPARNQLQIEIPDGVWQLDVYDLTGRMVDTREGVVGKQVFTLPVEAYNAGSYLLVARQNGSLHQTRFMVVR